MAAAERKCASCGGPLESGFVSTSNGSGLFWSHSDQATRLRPKDLEVLVPTAFSGMSSANLPGLMCRACGTISVVFRARK